MRSLGRLSIPIALILPIIYLEGCTNFTLVGAVNLGGQPLGEGHADDEAGDEPGAESADPEKPCFPSSKAAVAEMRLHGYSYKTWKDTAKWLDALAPVAARLPVCP